MDYSRLGAQQAASAELGGAQGQAVPRAASALGEAYHGLDRLSQQMAVLEARVHGPVNATNGGQPNGLPATYSALAEEIVSRVQQLNARVDGLLQEI